MRYSNLNRGDKHKKLKRRETRNSVETFKKEACYNLDRKYGINNEKRNIV